MQPKDQMSIAVEYCFVPNKSSGALYQGIILIPVIKIITNKNMTSKTINRYIKEFVIQQISQTPKLNYKQIKEHAYHG